MPTRTAKKQRKAKRSLQAPRNLGEALAGGWKIHEQLTTWQFKNANKREGFLILTNGKASSKMLMIRYTAFYELGEPYFLEADRP
jgi:hypothetical protein